MPTSAEMMHPKDATPLDELPGGMENSGGEELQNPQLEHERNLGMAKRPKDAYALDPEGQVVDTTESAKDVTKEGQHGMQDMPLPVNKVADASGDITVATPEGEVHPQETATNERSAADAAKE